MLPAASIGVSSVGELINACTVAKRIEVRARHGQCAPTHTKAASASQIPIASNCRSADSRPQPLIAAQFALTLPSAHRLAVKSNGTSEIVICSTIQGLQLVFLGPRAIEGAAKDIGAASSIAPSVVKISANHSLEHSKRLGANILVSSRQQSRGRN